MKFLKKSGLEISTNLLAGYAKICEAMINSCRTTWTRLCGGSVFVKVVRCLCGGKGHHLVN